MKKIICLYCTFIILISCNPGKSEITIKDSQSNNSISDLNAKKAEYSKKINELNLENSGSFLNYKGKKLEW